MREHAPLAACFSDIQGCVNEFSFRPFIGAVFGEIVFKFSPFLAVKSVSYAFLVISLV